MRSTTKTLLAHSFLLSWLIICLILYIYASRSDFVQIADAASWQAIVKALPRIVPVRYFFDLLRAWLGIMIFSLACLMLGLGILNRWAKTHSSSLAIGVTAFLLGEILFATIFLTLISIYRLTPIFSVGVLTAGSLAGLPASKAFLARLPRPGLPADFRQGEKIILGLIALTATLGSLYSSTRLGYDATAEYFSHAKIMAVSQLPILFYPSDSFVVSSLHPGILFTVIIQLFGDQSARMLPWVNGIGILLMGVALGQKLGLTPRACLWFLTLTVTSTAFLDLLGDGKIELVSTAPILAAAYWVLISLEKPTKAAFALVGILAGFAFISRPYNIFLVSTFMALFYASQIYAQMRSGHSNFRYFLKFSIWSLLPLTILGIFHLVENWFFLKDPLAPLRYAQGLSAHDWQWQFDPGYLAILRLLYPLTLTFMNSPQSLGNISPLFAGFVPFLLLKNVRENIHISRSLWALVLVSALTLFLWITLFFTVVEIRYVWFLWIILFLSIALLLESAIQCSSYPIRLAIYPLLATLLITMGIRTLFISLSTYSPMDSTGQAQCHDLEICTFIQPVNQTAAPGDRVLVLNAYRYYLRPDLFACSSRMEEYLSLGALASQDPHDFWVKVYRQGYRFITFEQHLSEQRYRFGKLPSPNSAPSWMHIVILYSKPDIDLKVYRIEVNNPPIESRIFCEQNSAGIWQLSSSSVSLP